MRAQLLGQRGVQAVGEEGGEEVRLDARFGRMEDFGLTSEEQMLVRETGNILMPSVRPRSFKRLDTPAQDGVETGNFDIYASALAEALTAWRAKTHGEGRFQVDVVANDPRRAGELSPKFRLPVDGV